MNRDQMQERTKKFTLDVIHLVGNMPNGRTAGIISKQMLRSATSVGANYRAAQRARSRREFSAKLGVVLEECDETLFWLDLLGSVGFGPADQVEALRREANELTSIMVSSCRSAASNVKPSSALPS